MTKLASRIATGIAILGLAAPAFAATTSEASNATAPQGQTSAVHHSRTHKHKRVASADEKTANPKKSEKKVEKKIEKKDEKKDEKKGDVKGAKTETPASPSTTPAPASK